jgi:hypothetical protein
MEVWLAKFKKKKKKARKKKGPKKKKKKERKKTTQWSRGSPNQQKIKSKKFKENQIAAFGLVLSLDRLCDALQNLKCFGIALQTSLLFPYRLILYKVEEIVELALISLLINRAKVFLVIIAPPSVVRLSHFKCTLFPIAVLKSDALHI